MIELALSITALVLAVAAVIITAVALHQGRRPRRGGAS